MLTEEDDDGDKSDDHLVDLHSSHYVYTVYQEKLHHCGVLLTMENKL